MSNFTMRLLKCPACGGPLDTPAGESSMKCPYCGNAVIIPESLRTPAANQTQPQGSLFSGLNLGAMMGAGAQWTEVVQLAQSGRRAEAEKKYMAMSGQSEYDARRVVESLAGAQTYEFTPGSGYTSVQVAPIVNAYADTAKSITRWSMWLGCGITAFVMIIIVITMLPVIIGVIASLWAAFNSF
ncbi:MAG: Trm112 family protein [Chloroflexota bacterium]